MHEFLVVITNLSFEFFIVGKSCRLRWFNQLDPKINREAFSKEEEYKLLQAHKIYGNKWAAICKLFPGRTDNAVKNHWHVIMARRQREQSSRKKRPTFQNASNGSLTSTIDESNSTFPHFNFATRPFLNYQAYGSQMGMILLFFVCLFNSFFKVLWRCSRSPCRNC